MTLYFKNGKYEIRIGEKINDKVVISLHRKYLKLIPKCESKIEISLSDNYPHPFPRSEGYTLNSNSMIKKRKYSDNPNNYLNNMNRYIIDLVENSFELNVLPEDFNYSSYFREQRLKKLMDK